MCHTCVKYEAQNLSGFCLVRKCFIIKAIVIGCGKDVGPTKKCE